MGAKPWNFRYLWGWSLRCGAEKSECLMRATKPSVLREKLQVLSFLPNVGSCAGDGVYSEVVSQPLLPSLTQFASCLLDVKRSLCQFLVFFQRNVFPVKQLQIPCVCGRRWVQHLSRHLELAPGEKDSKRRNKFGEPWGKVTQLSSL